MTQEVARGKRRMSMPLKGPGMLTELETFTLTTKVKGQKSQCSISSSWGQRQS